MSHDARYKKINAYAKNLPGGYQGSRRSLHRYLHRHVMLANFIELKEPGLSHTQFRQCFEHVQGIRAIAETRSCIRVFPCLFPDEKSIDFLISDKNHIRNESRPFTFSACYKAQPDELRALEAWRILRAALHGFELHKKVVDKVDVMLRKAFQPGFASYSKSLENCNPPPPPLTPAEQLWERCLVSDFANAYQLKLRDRESFNQAKKFGMVEMPGALAIRAGLVILPSERNKENLKHACNVYCEAGNAIYASIIQERAAAICKENPTVSSISTDRAKGDLVEVVLFQYRNNMIPHGAQALSYLESLIEQKLLQIHGHTDSLENETEESEEEGSEEEDEEEDDEVESGSNTTATMSEDEVITDEMAARDEPEGFMNQGQQNDYKQDMKDVLLMQYFKNISPETMRWNSLSFAQEDPYTENLLKVMVQQVYIFAAQLFEEIWKPVTAQTAGTAYCDAQPQISCHLQCKLFLEACRYRSLEFRKWNKDEEILEHKEYFFSELPKKAECKFRDYIEHSFRGKYQAACGLLDLHRGEVVALPSDMTCPWCLTRVEDDNLIDIGLHRQFDLGPGFRPPKFSPSQRDSMRSMIKDVKRNNTRLGRPRTSYKELHPDWLNPTNRLVVPCSGTTQWVWLRSERVITLGELFSHLCQRFTCRQIYYLYLCLDIVAVKQKKMPPHSKKRKRESLA